MVAGARSASFGFLQEKPEAVRITIKVAATETALYTKRGDCKLRSQCLALRQLCGPSVAVKMELTSWGEGSTCSKVCSVPSTCETPATSGVQRSHAFTWRSKAACSAGSSKRWRDALTRSPG